MPTSLLFDRQLSPAAAHTWAQLRALAWGKSETPALSIQQLAEVTGKKPSTLYGHMAALRDRDALRWRPADRGTLIVSFMEATNPESSGELSEFPENFSENLEKPSLNSPSESDIDSGSEGREGKISKHLPGRPGQHSGIPENRSGLPGSLSRKLEKPSLNYSTDSDIESLREEERGEGFEESSRKTGEAFQNSRKQVRSSGKSVQNSRKPVRSSGKDGDTPAQVYRRIAGISPNAAQRELIAAQVSDLPLWESSLEHWLSHGWNPRNLPGILDLYQRGGAAGCRFCQKAPSPKGGGSSSALDQLRKEYEDGYTE